VNVEEFEKLRGGEWEDEVYTIYKSSVGTSWTDLLSITTKKMPSAIVGIALNNDASYSWDIYREGKTVFPDRTMRSEGMESNMKEVPFFIPIEERQKIVIKAKADSGTVAVKMRIRLRYYRR